MSIAAKRHRELYAYGQIRTVICLLQCRVYAACHADVERDHIRTVSVCTGWSPAVAVSFACAERRYI